METLFNLIEAAVAAILFIFSTPIFFIIWISIKLDDGGPLFFKQKRTGKNKKEFYIYKIRTMVQGAEEFKKSLENLNETDGPVFKIHNDPRHTKVGRFLSHTGLDELPQLINIIKGEMSFVGPRPLPPNEAKKIPKKYRDRFLIKPGITSSWVVDGAHDLTFKQWMEKDLQDIKRKGFKHDFFIGLKTFLFLIKLSLQKVKNYAVLLFFLSVFLLGLGIRFYLAITRAMWADELFYFSTAVFNGFDKILLVQHWIKDNPPGFLLFVKVWALFGKNLLWLRLTGLISYVVSFFLLYSIFDKLKWLGKFVILSFFALSPFFISVNFWLSPYNFVLIFSLMQINLIKNFIEGRYDREKEKFILLFGFFNLLAVNSHYSAVYLFLSYPVLFLYFLIKNKKLLFTFSAALFISFVMLIPNINILFIIKSGLTKMLRDGSDYIVGPNVLNFNSLTTYFIDRSIFRFYNFKITEYFLALSSLLLLFFVYRFRKRFNLYFLFFLMFYLLPITLFSYLINLGFESIAAERTYTIFHIGFYFLIASILYYSEKMKTKFLYILLSLCFFSLSVASFSKLFCGRKNVVQAEVVGTTISVKGYDIFIDKVNEAFSRNFDLIYLTGNDKRVRYQKDIFLDYYFYFDSRLEQARNYYLQYARLINVKETDKGLVYYGTPKKEDKVLVINFEKTRSNNTFLKNAGFLKDREIEILDFWNPKMEVKY